MLKHYLSLLASLLLILAGITACGDSEGGSGGTGGEWAPEKPVAQEFRFYPDDKDDWVVKILPGETASGGLILMNANVTINKPYIYYTKTGKNTANVSFNFQRIAYNGGGVFYQCEYDLTFTSAHQGTYTGYMSVNLEEKPETGYFMFDSDEAPTVDDDEEQGGQEQPGGEEGQEPGGGEDQPGGGGGGGTDLSDPGLLKVAVTSASPSVINYQIQYRNPGDYKDEDDYLRAGICYGTSPHPTIFDQTGRVERVIPYSDMTSGIANLEENTTYYLRPFRETNGAVTYYEETSVTTVGTTPDSDLMLKMTYDGNNSMTYEYAINTDSSYKIDLWCWRLSGSWSPVEIGYKQPGDVGSGSYRYPVEWEQRTYFYLSARDLDSGIYYQSEPLYK